MFALPAWDLEGDLMLPSSQTVTFALEFILATMSIYQGPGCDLPPPRTEKWAGSKEHMTTGTSRGVS